MRHSETRDEKKNRTGGEAALEGLGGLYRSLAAAVYSAYTVLALGTLAFGASANARDRASSASRSAMRNAKSGHSARRIQQLGAGRCLRPGKVSPQRLKFMVESMLANPAYQTNAAALGASVRAGGHQRAARLILDHIHGRAQTNAREMAA